MTEVLLMISFIIVLCVVLSKISSRVGVPVLLFFIVLGMVFGSDGLIKIPFDNYALAENISTIAMVFIMFYGGFGTKWSAARPVAVKSLMLSSLGTVLTAGLTGVFCHFVLKIGLLESFLIGSVISSTDAASVFSILRSKKLNLRDNTASLLEVESGSNDPFAYMLTVIVLGLMNGNVSGPKLIYMLFAQVAYGAAAGIIVAMLALLFFKYSKGSSENVEAIFILAAALVAYAAPTLIGGNGYLSAYITGIILGNRRIPNKSALVNFYDSTTGLMQMLLFFMLGLLSFPSQLPSVALTGLLIALFLTFVARPLAVFAILTPFKAKLRQSLLVSWCGMRGAASIVFAILAVIDRATLDKDIFHIVFFIVLFSILIQGTLLPTLSKKLNMIDEEGDVMKTFTDYSDEVPVQFMKFTLPQSHKWVGRTVSNVTLPPDSIFVLLLRGDRRIVPDGQTVLNAGDVLVLSGKAAEKADSAALYEREIVDSDEWNGQQLKDIHTEGLLIIMVKRREEIIIPRGNTVIKNGDVLVMMDRDIEN